MNAIAQQRASHRTEHQWKQKKKKEIFFFGLVDLASSQTPQQCQFRVASPPRRRIHQADVKIASTFATLNVSCATRNTRIRIVALLTCVLSPLVTGCFQRMFWCVRQKRDWCVRQAQSDSMGSRWFLPLSLVASLYELVVVGRKRTRSTLSFVLDGEHNSVNQRASRARREQGCQDGQDGC